MATYKIPGPLCAADQRKIIFGNQFDLACSKAITNQQLEGIQVDLDIEDQDENHMMLAAIAYGEASTKNVYEEMAAIANTLVHRMQGQGHTSVASFFKSNPDYAYGTESVRYKLYIGSSASKISKNMGMMLALRAAENALSADPIDYSNGAFFWEGKDFADKVKNNERSERYSRGFKFSKPEHNIYDMPENKLKKVTTYWRDAKGKNTSKIRGEYEYTYETTAAYGGTIFIRYTDDWKKATAGKDWK